MEGLRPLQTTRSFLIVRCFFKKGVLQNMFCNILFYIKKPCSVLRNRARRHELTDYFARELTASITAVVVVPASVREEDGSFRYTGF